MSTGMLLRSLDPVRRLGVHFEAGPPVETTEGAVTPVYLSRWADRSKPPLTFDDFRRLHDEGVCAGCINLYHADERPDRIGIYGYDASDHYRNGPYVRTPPPPHPLKLVELQPELQGRVTRVKFKAVRFAEQAVLQPLEHLPCNVWADREKDTYLGPTS